MRVSPSFVSTPFSNRSKAYLGNAKFGCPACVAAATTVVTGVAGLTNATIHKSNATVATGISTAMGGFTAAFLLGLTSVLGALTTPVALVGGAVTSAFTAWSILSTQDHSKKAGQ